MVRRVCVLLHFLFNLMRSGIGVDVQVRGSRGHYMVHCTPGPENACLLDREGSRVWTASRRTASVAAASLPANMLSEHSDDDDDVALLRAELYGENFSIYCTTEPNEIMKASSHLLICARVAPTYPCTHIYLCTSHRHHELSMRKCK